MKKWVIMLAAATIAAGAFADSNTVSSANILGYIATTNAPALFIKGVQLDDGINTPQSMYGDTLPKGSTIYKFDGENYAISTYTDVFVPGSGLVAKWSVDIIFKNGEGYWLQLPGMNSFVNSGDVLMDDSITISINEGLQMLSYPYPVDRLITDLGLTPSKGDNLYVFDGTNYLISSYTDVFVPGSGLVTKWSNEDVEIFAGQGFWYETTKPFEWTVTRPF